MSDKNEFSKLVEDLDQKIKKDEKKRERVQEVIKTKAPPITKRSLLDDRTEKKFKEIKKHEKFRLKEKLTYAVIVFVLGHCLMVPLYLKFPDLFVGMFACASISLGIICVAVIDYT